MKYLALSHGTQDLAVLGAYAMTSGQIFSCLALPPSQNASDSVPFPNSCIPFNLGQ